MAGTRSICSLGRGGMRHSGPCLLTRMRSGPLEQPEAVALYSKLGYTPISLFEPYATAIPFSLCFEKRLR